LLGWVLVQRRALDPTKEFEFGPSAIQIVMMIVVLRLNFVAAFISIATRHQPMRMNPLNSERCTKWQLLYVTIINDLVIVVSMGRIDIREVVRIIEGLLGCGSWLKLVVEIRVVAVV
jgi:hypothetical protein